MSVKMEAKGGVAGAEVVVGKAANEGQTGKEVGVESAFAFRECVVLGRKGQPALRATSISLGSAGRYKVAVALNGREVGKGGGAGSRSCARRGSSHARARPVAVVGARRRP